MVNVKDEMGVKLEAEHPNNFDEDFRVAATLIPDSPQKRISWWFTSAGVLIFLNFSCFALWLYPLLIVSINTEMIVDRSAQREQYIILSIKPNKYSSLREISNFHSTATFLSFSPIMQMQ